MNGWEPSVSTSSAKRPMGSVQSTGREAWYVSMAASAKAPAVPAVARHERTPSLCLPELENATSSARRTSTAAKSSSPMTRRLTSRPTPTPQSRKAPTVSRRKARCTR